MGKQEKCIMPNFYIGYTCKGQDMLCNCRNTRSSNLVRHEVFYGTANRQKSIEYGLVVFITPEFHNMSDYAVHSCDDFNRKLKDFTQRQAMQFYNWSEQDFINIFGRSYLI